MAHRAALVYVSLTLSHTSAYTADKALVHHVVLSVYSAAFLVLIVLTLWMNGQAVLSWMAGYVSFIETSV